MSTNIEVLREQLHSLIRTVPDWPKPGVQFRDITPLFQKPDIWADVVRHFADRYRNSGINAIAGMEARGFIVGAALAHELKLAFIPIRKQGKLPYQTHAENYDLEYGTATVEIHVDACQPGNRVLLVDDLIATGGTLLAGKKLLQRIGADAIEAAVVIDLPDLGGTEKCAANGLKVYSLIQYDGD